MPTDSGQVFTGALAIIKVNGQPIGRMRNVRFSESIRRIPIRQLGSILAKEAAAVEHSGTISCSFWEINYAVSGVPNAIRRDVGLGNAASQIATGNPQTNFEDNVVLDQNGVTLDVYKKVKDAVDPATGLLIPGVIPYAIINKCFIESDNVNIDEGNVSGRDQSFVFLDPIIF